MNNQCIRKCNWEEADNRGFSLVELIICVAVLAIAIIPLYQSMTLSARTNAKAQSLQNATSLAESVMEEIKSSSIYDLKAKYNGLSAVTDPKTGKKIPNEKPLGLTEEEFWGDDTKTGPSRANHLTSYTSNTMLTGDSGSNQLPFYVLYKPQAFSTQGEKFDVVATIRSSTYAKSGVSDASDANSRKLPRIEEIDALSQAIISSKEFTKYDAAALDYFKQNSGVYDYSKKISSKEIIIDKEDSLGTIYDQVSVNCRVVYKDNTPSSDGGPNLYSRELFSGTFGAPTRVERDGSTTVLPLASNIYLFYKRTQTSEIITVNDTSTKGTHKVFLVAQQDGAVLSIAGTTVKINNSIDDDATPLISFSSNGDLDDDGNIISGDYELITNMTKDGDNKGHLYKEQANIRIYEVNVSLIRDGKEYVTLNSTKEANDSFD